MEKMGIKEKQSFKSFRDAMFVLLCILIFVGVVALGIWIGHTCFGLPL